MAAGDPSERWHAWWAPVLTGAVSIVAGLLAIAWPHITLLALAIITGINLMVLGGLAIGEAFAGDEDEDGSANTTLAAVVGVLGVLAGIVVIRRPGETLLVLIVILGLWLVLSGVVQLVRAVVVAGDQRLLRALGGLVDAGIGICVLALPKLTLGTLAVLAGCAFVVHGAVLIVRGFRMRGMTASAPRPAAQPERLAGA
jgi:uncharacterized membrane protein HdeD (DUF308 family)